MQSRLFVLDDEVKRNSFTRVHPESNNALATASQLTEISNADGDISLADVPNVGFMQPNRRKFASRTIGCLLCARTKRNPEGEKTRGNEWVWTLVESTTSFLDHFWQFHCTVKELVSRPAWFHPRKFTHHFSTLEEEKSIKTQREKVWGLRKPRGRTSKNRKRSADLLLIFAGWSIVFSTGKISLWVECSISLLLCLVSMQSISANRYL